MCIRMRAVEKDFRQQMTEEKKMTTQIKELDKKSSKFNFYHLRRFFIPVQEVKINKYQANQISNFYCRITLAERETGP